MSKERKPKTDTSRFGELTDQAAEITGKEKSKSFSIEDTKPPEPKKNPELTNRGRKKFTTMITPELRKLLQNVADNNAISIADALEIILEEYFNIK
jgi:hypothetical protein